MATLHNQPEGGADSGLTGGVTDEFVRRLTECQNRLYVYILALLPDADRARDVLQEANVVLWRKADQFQAGTSFQAWACKVAYYEVLSERRRRGRDKLLFNNETLELVAEATEGRLDKLDERALALDECLQRLDQRHRQRLHDRYGPGGSVELAASQAGQTRGSIAVTLHRIRSALLRCIENKLLAGGST